MNLKPVFGAVFDGYNVREHKYQNLNKVKPY